VRGAGELPPAAPAAEDIATLAEHFLTRFWARHRRAGTPRPVLSDEALPSSAPGPWKGNVRELQNLIEHVTVVAEPGRPIYPDDIPVYDEEHDGSSADAGVPAAIYQESFHAAKEQLIAHFEREYLGRLSARAAGNMSRAARLAGIDRTTLYRLMEKHQLRREDLPSPLVGMAG
jgi:DNA-binding NtrC family response regulator